MAFELRPYQAEVKREIEAAWAAGARNVLAVLPTGAGKTVTFSDIIMGEPGAVVAIAHRQELVSQISLALARDGVRHRIIGPTTVVKFCVRSHMEELGASYFDPASEVAVAGVDTLVRRDLNGWASRVRLWVQDEAHHVLTGNKWGKAVEMFPNARGLGVTATPLRADRQGLGREFDGVFDTMIVGPGMRELIDQGHLTDYRIFAPPSDLVVTDDMISKTTGDFKLPAVGQAVRRSSVIGDVVDHYKKIAGGKLGVTFATDVEISETIAEAYREAGVPAEAVSAKTPATERAAILRRFRNRELMQLVNCDLFGEGFDLPAIEVVSMARPTQSYGLFVQQFGRALRLMEGKREALIIDHVGNVTRHGLPDAPRTWSLARIEGSRGSSANTVTVKTCPQCTGVFERFRRDCPFCGHYPEPASRSRPEFVDGDLLELDPETLAEMRAQVAAEDVSVEEYRAKQAAHGIPGAWQMSNVKKHAAKLETREELRLAIATWAGGRRAEGYTDAESYRQFFINHGVDVLSAQLQDRAGMGALAGKIRIS